MLNNSGLHLNKDGTARLVNNFYFSLAKLKYRVCVDTVQKRMILTTIHPTFSSRKSRPSVDQFTKIKEIWAVMQKIYPKRNFVTFPSVQTHRHKNPKNVIVGHLNVNSLRNKFVAVEELIKDKIDVCLISETKIDESFPNQQFKKNVYKMFRNDRDRFGGGLMFYVGEQVASKVLSLESISIDIKLILLEFTVKNRRWLCIGIYRPLSQNEKYFIDQLSKTLGELTCQ